MSQPVLEAKGLSWCAGSRQILGPLDLSVERGECIAIIGPNGAGKTSLLRLLTGVLRPTAGALYFADEPYQNLKARHLALRIAYVPQVRPSRLPLSVEEVVLQGRFPHLSRFQMGPGEEDFQVVAEALATVELTALRQRSVDLLSGGERQAVFIAAALAQRAPVIILDEPTTHLDPKHQRDIVRILDRLREDHGPTIILATHDLRLASRADRVLALSEGCPLALDVPEVVLRPESLEELFATSFQLTRVQGNLSPVVEW